MDTDRYVVYINHAARCILRRHAWIQLRDGRLNVRGGPNAARLESAMKGRGSEKVFLQRRSSEDRLVITVRGPSPQTRLLKVFLWDLCCHPDYEMESLKRLYALSPTETRLCAMLLEGRCLSECARLMKITRNTVRAHLKSVFLKLRTNRQGDMIRLILQGPTQLLK